MILQKRKENLFLNITLSVRDININKVNYSQTYSFCIIDKQVYNFEKKLKKLKFFGDVL